MGLAAPESNGKSERTEALYREHGAAVAAFCRSRLRDRSDAEDATQQVFLSAHRALLNGTVPREPLAWLLTVARHECYARFRQGATALLPAGEAPEGATADASVHVLRAGELASIWDEIERMPAAQRDAFLLREIRGLSYGQLAAELSLSPPSVRSLLLRGRTRLRSRLGDVAAGLGGAEWVQTLLRLAGGGEGASPVPTATKALAVGVGALALAGGGDVPRLMHHSSSAPRPAAHRWSAAHERRAVAAPVAVSAASVRREDRPRLEDADRERSRGRGGGDRSSQFGSDRSGSHESGDDSSATASGTGSQTSGDDGGSDSSTTTTVAQPTNSGDTSSGSSSGSDGGPAPSSTTSSSGSDGGPDSSASGSPDDSTGSPTSDGGGGSSLDGGGGGSDGGGSGHDG
jgi:RNA polymerase sigma-70 factor (ECF subfamily)